MDEALPVGLAVIARGSRYLVRIRPPGGPMPGVWEFPGGKAEPGESPKDAATREALEETGLVVRITGDLAQIGHHYPHGPVALYYYDCAPEPPEAEPDPHSGFVWVEAQRLPGMEFPPANGPVLAALARRHATGKTDRD